MARRDVSRSWRARLFRWPTLQSRTGWPSAAEQEWPAAATDALREQLNAADLNMLAPEADAPAEPTVTPPLYAGTAIARTR